MGEPYTMLTEQFSAKTRTPLRNKPLKALVKSYLLFLAALLLTVAASADTLQLKGKTTIIGKIVADKPDQVAVDIGYTVLLVPRSQILSI
jgi:hypothetical protein